MSNTVITNHQIINHIKLPALSLKVEEKKWFAREFTAKCYTVFNKICQKLFGCKSISEYNLESSLKYANGKIAANDSLIETLTVQQEKGLISDISALESHFDSYLNSPKGINDKDRLRNLKISLNKRSSHLHISSACTDNISSNSAVREELLKEMEAMAENTTTTNPNPNGSNEKPKPQQSSLHKQLLKDIERSPLKKCDENDNNIILNEEDLPKDSDGNIIDKYSLESKYDDLDKLDKMKVLISCQKFYIIILNPLVRGYLNLKSDVYAITGPKDKAIKYNFEFDERNNQVTIKVTNLIYMVSQDKIVKEAELNEISFTMTLKDDFESTAFQDLTYDLIQQYTINNVSGLNKLYTALSELNSELNG